MEVKNACTKCGCINTIDIHSLLRKDITDKDGNHYLVLYFKCEQCKAINVVQIDNNETRQLYRTFKSLLIKVMKKRVITIKKGTIVSDSKQGDFDDEN